jgi:hypothetical protein
MFRNLDTGMTRDKYFTMMEQLEQEPKDSEIPPDWEDLPDIMVYAMNTFNSLGDRVYPDIGFVGKDYTNLSTYMKIYEIQDPEYFLEILQFLDSRAIKKSQEQLKREHDKLKRKK